METVGGDSGGQDLHPDLAGPWLGKILFYHLQHVRPAAPFHNDAVIIDLRHADPSG
jgi:hypothetical protein